MKQIRHWLKNFSNWTGCHAFIRAGKWLRKKPRFLRVF